jgi:hypothetical protein
MGIGLGHIGADSLGLVTMVGLVTIMLSTYMILYSEPLYRRLAPLLGGFERARPLREMAYEEQPAEHTAVDVLVFGLGRYGSRVISDLIARGVRVAGVDFDPEAVRAMRNRGTDARFGDAEDPHLLSTLPLEQVRWIVSTMPSVAANLALLDALKQHGYRGTIAVALHSDSEPDAERLRACGATHLLYPYADAADYAADLVADNLLATAGAPP